MDISRVKEPDHHFGLSDKYNISDESNCQLNSVWFGFGLCFVGLVWFLCKQVLSAGALAVHTSGHEVELHTMIRIGFCAM